LQGERLTANATELLLTSPDPLQRNSFRDANKVVPKTTGLHCAGACKITLPPDSVAVITLRDIRGFGSATK
jgi:hypothetical protein